MTTDSDLRGVAMRLADRRQERTEANVQSDLHMLLRLAPLDLEEGELHDIVLESPAGARRRIDVEVGSTVFEVKRDLRVGNVRADAEAQLAGYVASQTERMQRRYVGVLTDGAEWQLYHLIDDVLTLVSGLHLNPTSPDVEGLTVWLESVLATADRVRPTPREIAARLGADSPSHALDYVDLSDLYRQHRHLPTVKVKRELWSKLLTTAFGTNFADEDDLFVNHTLLVATAEIIGHAVLDFDLTDEHLTPAALVSGALFTQAQIGGVVEADFFDWIIEVPGGDRFVRSLARRLARFDWGAVEHDVMKVLYESVIDAEQRHRLGEYYTPDWLAEEMVASVVDDPLVQRVLDPGCGSGTFVFHAVRRYLDAAATAARSNAETITGVTSTVIGVDVHPVAVTFARVTYLLAIGTERLRAHDRPAFSVPVYLGDSVQWGQQRDLLSADALTVPTAEGAQLFGDELRFPQRLLADAGRFDQLVAELADKATKRSPGTAPPSLAAVHRRYAVHPDDELTLEATFRTMCALHDTGRDHIWGYYVRNLARPVWLSYPENRVDRLVGNPPWLAYRFMTEAMKASFRAMAEERNQWHGAGLATHQDLSGIFVARSIELYLKAGGRFGFVMPLAALSRRQFAGFRKGDWPSPTEPVKVGFDRPWDLHLVKPSFFPVPASVLFGQRREAATPVPAEHETWAGRLPGANLSWAAAADYITRSAGERGSVGTMRSPYGRRFVQGATFSPRFLFLVETSSGGPLGAGAGRRRVTSRRTPLEKKPWKDLPSMEGSVESHFITPLHLGETLLPHRLLTPTDVVLPWDGERLLSGSDERLDLYPGLSEWWRRAEVLWMQNRSSDRMTLLDRLDFRKGLTQQFPPPEFRVLYTKAGMYCAAAVLRDTRAVVDTSLYAATAASEVEARYLTAILNSSALTSAVRPLQARGEHNPRHFDLYIWQLPIPLFDPSDAIHQRLAALAAECEELVASLDLDLGRRFETVRRLVREALTASPAGAEIEEIVEALLAAEQNAGGD